MSPVIRLGDDEFLSPMFQSFQYSTVFKYFSECYEFYFFEVGHKARIQDCFRECTLHTELVVKGI